MWGPETGRNRSPVSLRSNVRTLLSLQTPACDGSCPARSTADPPRTGAHGESTWAPHKAYHHFFTIHLWINPPSGVFIELSLSCDPSTVPHWWRIRAFSGRFHRQAISLSRTNHLTFFSPTGGYSSPRDGITPQAADGGQPAPAANHGASGYPPGPGRARARGPPLGRPPARSVTGLPKTNSPTLA